MRRVYQDAHLNTEDCGFVEMHGTGTKVGDPIEAAAAHAALGRGRTPKDPLYIGSVKSNVGHLEGASGVVSLIKAAMMLENGLLLPNADFLKANQNIPLNEWNMKVSCRLSCYVCKLIIMHIRLLHRRDRGREGRNTSASPTTGSEAPMLMSFSKKRLWQPRPPPT